MNHPVDLATQFCDVGITRLDLMSSKHAREAAYMMSRREHERWLPAREWFWDHTCSKTDNFVQENDNQHSAHHSAAQHKN